jgi:hypothetical protein
VPAHAETRCIRDIPEGLGRCCGADLVRGDVEGTTGVGHFVGVGDADHALAVFVELCHFCDFGGGDPD